MAVTFTRRTRTIAESTGLSSETETTIEGSCMELMSGQNDLYESAKLTREQGRLLMFTPTAYGDTIEVGDEVEWPEDSGDVFSAKAVKHLRPDGVVILSYAVVAA